ncbi:MAG TPA: hypothetical protein VL125_10770 [Pelobium sp.]|nr:hypothetical protein [Pelobium sp.]
MKRIIKIFSILFAWTVLFASCSPEKYGLGDIDVVPSQLVEGIAFKIEHDPANPNIVYLSSLMDSKYTPIWDHPQGRSQDQKVTLKIPFAGTYTVKFGVQTRGGVVYGEPATFTISQMYAGFISDEMWTMISGGAGQEKTWYLDLDAEGVSRKFLGPMYFARSWYTWDGLHTAGGDNYIDAAAWDWQKAILPTVDREGDKASGAPKPGVQAWIWTADWKGNQWMADKADFGTMTFDLKDNANVTVDQEAYGLGKKKGTFLLDVENHTIKFTDVKPLHDKNRDGDAVDWANVRILYLTKDAMQLGVVPNGDDAAMTVYNYISKDYRDNWIPGNQPAPEPPYQGNANDDLTTSTSTKKAWGLSLQTPYNWTNLAGEFLNSWTKVEDYVASGWAPYIAATVSKVSLELDKAGDNNGSYKFTDGSGNPISGTYTTDDKNNIVFDKNISFAISDWVSLGTTDENKLRIIKTEKDALGNITGLWLGKKDPLKDEYMVFKFEPKASGGAVDPMTAWKNALAGKTFAPDVNYFADWVTNTWTGGWTKSIYPSDFSSQGWFWDQNTYNACLASSIKYYLDGTTLKADAIDNGVAKNGIVVNIDTEDGTLTYSEAPFTFSWLFTNNNTGKGPWLFGSYDGASLSNINTKGMYLGFVADPTKPAEYLMIHLVKK